MLPNKDRSVEQNKQTTFVVLKVSKMDSRYSHVCYGSEVSSYLFGMDIITSAQYYPKCSAHVGLDWQVQAEQFTHMINMFILLKNYKGKKENEAIHGLRGKLQVYNTTTTTIML